MFPNLQGIKEPIGIDIETYDPDLIELGPGCRRPGNYILGVGISTLTKSWYFSLEHPLSENVNKINFFNWVKTLENETLVGANILYDLDWLQYQNFSAKGKMIDVQYNEALINNEKLKYNLDSLCQEYLNETKHENEIEKYCLEKGWKGKPQNHLWKMPSSIVGPYCQADAQQALRVYQKQLPILQQEELTTVFELECGLIPLMLQMRRVGVRIDEEKLNLLDIKYTKKIKELQENLNKLVGFDLNINAARSIQKAFEKLGLKYSFTEKGNPSFTHNLLENHGSDLSKKILELRQYIKTKNTFIAEYNDKGQCVSGLKKFIVNGRIHCLFNQLRGDDKGTVSGRFSSSNPNLQQIPSRVEEIKNDIRGLFIPEEGCDWVKGDQSQIEMRIFFHYARGAGAEELRQLYRDNPHTDCYVDFAKIGTGKKEITKNERSIYKKITLGVLYGMWVKKLCIELKLDFEEGKKLIYAYFNKVPAILQTTGDATVAAERRGYVKTILGRRARFPNPKFAYIAFNRIDQGSAADLMKKSMLDAYRAGLFNILTPHLTVHDEMDVSMPRTKEGLEAIKELKHISENCIKFKIPIIFELEKGPNWAELEKFAV